VSLVKAAAQLHLRLHHALGAAHQALVIGLDAILVLGQLLYRMPECLARYRAAMRARAADLGILIDHRHAFSRLDRGHRRTFAAGAGADYDYVVVVAHGCSNPISHFSCISRRQLLRAPEQA